MLEIGTKKTALFIMLMDILEDKLTDFIEILNLRSIIFRHSIFINTALFMKLLLRNSKFSSESFNSYFWLVY